MYAQEFLQLLPMLESYLYDNYSNSTIYHHGVDESTRMDFVLKSTNINTNKINKKKIN